MNKDDLIKAAQKSIGVTPDGDWGPVTTKKAEGFDLVGVMVKPHVDLPPSAPDTPSTSPKVKAKHWAPLVINGVQVHPTFDVPAPYTHLHPLDFVSHFIGEHEVSGAKDNTLLAHTHEHSKNLTSPETSGAGDAKNNFHDETPYCSSGLNWTADGCGCEKTDNALASSWDHYVGRSYNKGDKVHKGALVRLAHPGGHITLAAEDFIWTGTGSFKGVGFNQGNSVKVSSYAQNTIVTVHDWAPKPGTVLAPIGTNAKSVGDATGGPGESTR